MKRLTKAYQKAYRIPFNNDSKFVLFSDVHRGDNSISDEFSHNQNIYQHALNHYYKQGFTYIEVGDGDELWEHEKFKYVIRAYGDIYKLISKFYKNNRFHMLYGNHNMELKYDAYVKKNLAKFYDIYEDEFEELFPGLKVHEAVVLEHEATEKEIFVVHGHQGDFFNDQIWPISKFLNRHLWHYLHVVGFRNPSSPSKNMHKCHRIERNYSKWIRRNQRMLIAGHTHRPKYISKTGESYFNTGACVFPLGITGLEIEDGNITLVKWHTRPDRNGSLIIQRERLKGPNDLKEYMY
ncbi:MAG TPA: serine/threonine protein phosphatase [Eubacteriaceae bacterium]|nr:serine/threonine protein phosphatase [Eubacteriaceae bacterium]